MKNLLSVDIQEVGDVMLRCSNCGAKTSVNVYCSQHTRIIDRMCPSCGKEFNSMAVDFAVKFDAMLFNFKKMKSEKSISQDIVFEIET